MAEKTKAKKEVIDGDSGKPQSELPALTITNQDDREYWNQARVLASTGCNTKISKDGIITWFDESMKTFVPKEDAKILVIGCGPGRIIKGMRQLLDHPKWEIIAIEGSKGMVERAIKNNEGVLPEAKGKELCKLKLTYCNAMDMTYKEEFDVIWTCTVLQHNSFKNKSIFIPKMYDSLKPGGYYICLEGTKTEQTWVDPTHEYPEGQFKHYKEKGRFTYNWHDEKGAKGTAAWFIDHIGKYGFEIQLYGQYHVDWFVFRKIREVGSSG